MTILIGTHGSFPQISSCRAGVTAIAWDRVATILAGWLERGRQRHALDLLDDRLLDDIGVRRIEAAAESRRLSWYIRSL